jgi:hypothetical protein
VTSDKLQNILSLGTVSKLQRLLSNGDQNVQQQASITMTKILQTEDAVREFLNSGGCNVVRDMLESTDAEIQYKGAEFLLVLLKKKGWSTFIPSELHPLAHTKENSQSFTLIGRATDITRDRLFVHHQYTFEINDNQVKPHTLSHRQGQSPGGPIRQGGNVAFTSSQELAFGCWLYLDGTINNDGIPIFLKGKPNFTLQNKKTSNCLIRGDCLFTEGRVYFEITLRSISNIQVGWISKDFASDSSEVSIGDKILVMQLIFHVVKNVGVVLLIIVQIMDCQNG